MNIKNRWLLGALAPVTLVSSIVLYESGGKQHLTPYRDLGGVWTVCDGHTGSDVIPGKTYTPQECNNLTIKDVSEHGKGVLNCVNVQITQQEYEAYTSFAYNVGVTTFCASNIVKTLNAGNHRLACQGLFVHPNGKPAWSYVNGKYVQGLANRRYKEYLTCIKGVNG